VKPVTYIVFFRSARSGAFGTTRMSRAPPSCSMPRAIVSRPPSASEVMSTMAKAPSVMLRTVRSDRSLCAERAFAAIAR
jgi:hypothetical protein